MGNLFWRLSNGTSIKGLAERDNKAMDALEVKHGDMEYWVPMHRVLGVPIHVRLRGGKVNDIIWTWDSQCLIQDRVLQMFRNEGFTGFQVHPVSAKWKRRINTDMPEIPIYWELIPTGWGGMAPEESGIHRVPPPSDGPDMLRYSEFTDPTRLMDENQWDGSDFFILWPMPAYFHVTDRVAQFIRRNNLKTAVLERLDKLPTNVWGVSGYGPGPLRWYLPEPRAREIGEPLGIY